MRYLLVILWCLSLGVSTGRAAQRSAAREAVHSRSGQFVIAGKRLAPAKAVFYGVDTNWSSLVPVGRQAGSDSSPVDPGGSDDSENPVITLDPAYLAASAERVRSAIYEQLGLFDQHRGTVYITLLRPTFPPQEIVVIHMLSKRGGVWDYRLEIPETVRSDYLLRALTHVILLEVANRHGRPHLAEVPLWLREGMVEHLRVTTMKSAFFNQGQKVSYVARLNEEIANLKRELHGETLFGLEELSWPGSLKSGPATERMFRLTSHAMVTELLLLPGGGRYLGETLRLLPQYQNWQFAFLQAYRKTFGTLLDVEKWWSVTSLNLSGVEVKPQREEEEDNANIVFRTELDTDRWNRVMSAYLGMSGANEEWTFGESYLRLSELLLVPVERQEEEDGEVFREEIMLPDLLTSMTFSLQKPMIERLIAELFGLQLHAPQQLVGLIRDYRFVLEKYLLDVEATYTVRRSRFSQNISPVVVTQRTLRKLNDLEGRRVSYGNILDGYGPPIPGKVAVSETPRTLP